jgi:hypothetical protein
MIAAYQAALVNGFTTDFTTSRVVGDANTPDYRVQAYLKSLEPRPQITCNDTQSFNVATGGPIHTTPATFSAWTSCAATDIVAVAIDSTSATRGIASTSVTPNDGSALASGLIVLTNIHSGGQPQLQSFAPTSLLPSSQTFNLGGLLFNLTGTKVYALSTQGNLYCFNIPATTTPASPMTACSGSWPAAAATASITYSTAFPTYGATDIEHIYFGDDGDHINCVQGGAASSPGTACWTAPNLIAGGDNNEAVGPVVVNIDSTTGYDTIYAGDNSGRFFRITNNGSAPATGSTIERSDLCTHVGQSSPCAANWGVHGSPTLDFTSSNAFVTAAGYMFQFPLTKEQSGGSSWGGGTTTYKNLNTLQATTTTVDGSTTLDHVHGYAYVAFAGYLFKAAYPFDGNLTDKTYDTQLTQTVSGALNYPIGYPLLYSPYNSIYIGTGTNAGTTGLVETYALNGNGAAPPLAGVTSTADGAMVESGAVLDWANGNLYYGYDSGPGTTGGIVQYPAGNPNPTSAWKCPTGETLSSGGVCVTGCGSATDCTPLTANVKTAACVSGACEVATTNGCNANYADCDGQWADGCEVNVESDPNNCGACASKGGTVCPTTNDTPACDNGSCSVTCNSGYGICAPGNVNTSGCPTAISCSSCCNSGPGGSNSCAGGTACIGGSCAATTQAVCGTEDEDYSGTNPVVVACPEGETIQAISFMSYGTPNGSCGSFSKGSCDDSNGSSGNNNEGLIASNACYGKQTCSIDPSNGVFGDPCGGTYKKMAIQVQCACAPVLSLCANGYQDGDETDVDCGGGAESGCSNSGNVPTACATGKKCSQNSDCQSNVCTSGICGASAPPTPIAYYPLTEQTGTTTANQAPGATGGNGTLNNTTWAGTGEGVTFSGSQTSYIQASGFSSLGTTGNAFTLALWVKPTATAGILVNVANQSSGSPGWCTPFIGFNSSGQVVAQVWSGSTDVAATSPSALTTGTWTHIAETYSTADGVRLYINGTEVASTAATYSASGSADYIDWGANQTGNACALGTITNAAYSGGMDLMYVYNAELTAAQVATLASTAPSGACTTTIACATNVGTGSTATVTCPAGSTIEAIEFASFGTPSGTCGSFSTGSCDDSNNSSGNNQEREIASAACYGLSSCNINVSTSTFGDPCTGTTKYFDVQAECGCAPIAAQCANGYEDGSETDIDCGGGTCGRCATGKKCLVNSDCTSNDCSSGVCTSFPTALASYALAEQSGSTTVDGTGNGHTGTLYDEGSTSSNIEWAGTGEGITFPGSQSAYMQADGFSSSSSSLAGSNPFTLALWVKPTTSAGILVNVASQASGQPGWCTPFLGFNSSGEIVGQVWNGSTDIAVTGPVISTGTWSHVALTYSAADGIILYVNGSKVGQTTVTYSASNAASPADYLDWGGNQGPNSCALGTITSAAYSGGMDLMYVYNVELTAAQVSSLASEAPAGVCTASIACAQSVANGSSATVTCPLGSTIEAIEFVSYGNPSGACGTFATGSCDASPQERAVASAACYGQSSCTIPVSQAAFGSPSCSSSSSYLDIQAECGCPPIATQCANGYEDGSETDVDCGGGTCQRCGNAKKCSLNSDCVSNSCSGGTCAAFPSAVASYALEEQSGTTTADGATGAHNATLYGATTWAGAGDGVTLAGAVGSYLQASGFSDLGDRSPVAAFTLSLWAKPVSSTGVLLNVSSAAAGNGWCTPFLGFNASNEVVGQIWNGSADVQATAPSALPTGAWAHIALAWSPSDDTLRLYINGTQVATASVAYSASGSADYIEWGSNLGQSCAQGTITPGDYQGGMDYMEVYNIELTQPQIAVLAAQAPTGAACTAGSQCYSGVCEGTNVCE